MIQASYIHNAGSTWLHNSEQAFITVGYWVYLSTDKNVAKITVVFFTIETCENHLKLFSNSLKENLSKSMPAGTIYIWSSNNYTSVSFLFLCIFCFKIFIQKLKKKCHPVMVKRPPCIEHLSFVTLRWTVFTDTKWVLYKTCQPL